jgi:ubiquinol-cytochrome c reductase cytochrome b subunit
MFGSILLLFFLPWLDTSPVRSGRYRPLFFWVGLVPCVLVLGYCGGAPAEESWLLISQVAAIYYFAHFLIILPLVARWEKPLPLPDSITASALGEAAPAERT